MSGICHTSRSNFSPRALAVAFPTTPIETPAAHHRHHGHAAVIQASQEARPLTEGCRQLNMRCFDSTPSRPGRLPIGLIENRLALGTSAPPALLFRDRPVGDASFDALDIMDDLGARSAFFGVPLNRNVQGGYGFAHVDAVREVQSRCGCDGEIRADSAGSGLHSSRVEYGILPSHRSANGYRVFADEAVEVIATIRTLLDAGYSIKLNVSSAGSDSRATNGTAPCPGFTSSSHVNGIAQPCLIRSFDSRHGSTKLGILSV